jgi:hypothetical protein
MTILGKRLIAGVSLLIGITITVILYQQRDRQHILQHVQEDEIVSYLEDGDVICRLGDRLWSDFFSKLSPSEKRFSHLGIIRKRNNIVSVINAEGLAVEGKDYVNEVSLKDFLQIAQSIGIYRLRTIKGELISNMALEYMGRHFDWQFDMEEDNKIYCTELLYVILEKIDPTIKLNKKWLGQIGKYIIPPDVCSQSEYFIEIGYWGNNAN